MLLPLGYQKILEASPPTLLTVEASHFHNNKHFLASDGKGAKCSLLKSLLGDFERMAEGTTLFFANKIKINAPFFELRLKMSIASNPETMI